nr:Druantia anti-phage system protein DruA [Candidatus Accumulibacter sp. ACC003]
MPTRFPPRSGNLNWIKVGQTAGRGKKCPTRKSILPIKDIWLYPLHRAFRSVLCR